MYDLEGLVGEDGFLEALGQSLDREVPPPVLRDAKIKITSRCNLRCTMCKYWRNRSEDALPTAQWKEVLDQLVALGCRKVHFSGGEVLVRNDFLELVEHTVGIGLKTNLTTNGTLIDRQVARQLARAGANSISVSLDGPTARLHDEVRGVEGAFARTLRGIRWLQRYADPAKRRPKLRINVVLMESNFRRLPEMLRLAGELGAIDLCAMPVDEKGESNRRLSRSQIELYNRDIAPQVQEARKELGFPVTQEAVFPFGVTPEEVAYSKKGLYARGLYERQCCLAPWLHTFIAWSGEVYPCCMTSRRIEPLGNVVNSPLAAIFDGAPYHALRRAFRGGEHLPACHGCDLFLVENRFLHAALAPVSSQSVASTSSAI
jgi:MoaA/NifB/PqqE/SkfB family radical SAM enzyme